MAKLKGKRELFCQEYIIDRNATQAAIRAGYSEKTAHSQGPRLLDIVEVQQRIANLDGERMERLQIDQDYVLKRLTEIDQLDIYDIFTDDLRALKPLSEWPKAWRQSISGLDVSELFEYMDGEKELNGFLKKIKWPDKVRNLELLGKHVKVKAFQENVKHSLDDDLAQAITEARKRVGQS